MRLLDSRRLTGPNLLLDRAGAAIEVALPPGVPGGAEAREGPDARDGLNRLEAPDRLNTPEVPDPQVAIGVVGQAPGTRAARDGLGALDAPEGPGAPDALDVAGQAIRAWQEEAARLLAAVGWGEERLAVRRYSTGASLALTAPLDALYAATDLAEAAWEAAAARLGGTPAPDFAATAARLAGEIARESNPALLRLAAAAGARGVQFLWDDEQASVGSGTGCLAWPLADLPAPEAVDWSAVHDVPILLVTGTNGKTTTVRLLGAMIAAAGRVPGLTTTDRVSVGSELLAEGDFSGPGGARLVLRDRRVEMAVLEAARGGILRRGLAVTRAAACLVTNVAADHLGDYGIEDLEGLAEAKLVVARAVGPEGRVVLNAADPGLAARGSQPGRFRAPVAWFSLDPGAPPLSAHLAAGGEAALLEGDALVLRRGDERREVVRVEEVPIALGGAARYNLANALGALALGSAAGLPVEAMAEALRRFGKNPEENPGRAHLLDWHGARVLLDYAHNPHGLDALLDVAAALPAARRLVLLGQAGDRDDQALRELAQAAWRFAPDRIVVKEMTSLLRGREPGEVPAILEDELRRLGAGDGTVEQAPDEVAGVKAALAWARPGDLLVLLVHTDRDAVMELLAGSAAAPS